MKNILFFKPSCFKPIKTKKLPEGLLVKVAVKVQLLIVINIFITFQ